MASVTPLRAAIPTGIRARLELVLARYEQARAHEAFGRAHPLWETFGALRDALADSPPVATRRTVQVSWSAGRSRWSDLPWIALLDARETKSTRQGVYAAYLFRADLSGVYLALVQGVAGPRRQLGRATARTSLRRRATDLRAFCRELPEHGFRLDDLIELGTDTARGADYEAATIAYKLYPAGEIPDDAALVDDLDAVLRAYHRYVGARRHRAVLPGRAVRERPAPEPLPEWDRAAATEALIGWIEARGWIWEPWQIAAYVAALRTKPFAILAGVSGTGKSRLPALVAEATGGRAELIPVRPDWTDSAEALGYTDLGGVFRPGAVLRAAMDAAEHPRRHWTCVLDEMNLARPEHWFAEVLSRIEDRRPTPRGGWASEALLPTAPEPWDALGLPPNLALVGTVNMDESAHGFSRKVLDRAFTLELSDTDLARWDSPAGALPEPTRWPVAAWHPRALRLSELRDTTEDEQRRVRAAVDALLAANRWLAPAGAQAGYRTRDETALFTLHAAEISSAFRTRDGAAVDPLDLALDMKLLPRLAGGSTAVLRAVRGLLGWAWRGREMGEEDATALVADWERAGRPGALPGAVYPRTAARLCLMWERLLAEGFTAYWA